MDDTHSPRYLELQIRNLSEGVCCTLRAILVHGGIIGVIGWELPRFRSTHYCGTSGGKYASPFIEHFLLCELGPDALSGPVMARFVVWGGVKVRVRTGIRASHWAKSTPVPCCVVGRHREKGGQPLADSA